MHRIFKNILSEDELKDQDIVKQYLEFSFHKRRTEKDPKCYINICKIFNYYPETVKDIINNINILGYYKDYFHILKYSRNDILTNYIHDLVRIQIKKDLQNLKDNKNISTLGKWLPRENSKMNRKTNFIDVFCSNFFNETNKFTARKKYRKMKTMLNDKLGTLEAKMCTNKMEEIDFEKVSPLSFKRNISTIIKHDECWDNLIKYQENKLMKLSLGNFIENVMDENNEIDLVQKIWDKKKYLMSIPFIEKNIGNSVCIIDMSKDTFLYTGEYIAIGLALLIDKYSTLNNKIYIPNLGFIYLDGNIREKVKKFLTYCIPVKEFNLLNYYNDIMSKDPSCKTMVLITNKKINDYNFLSDKNITFVKYEVYNNTYDTLYYNGTTITKYKKHTNYNENIQLFKEEKKNINSIIVQSDELNSNWHKYFIVLLLLSWLFLKIMGFFYY